MSRRHPLEPVRAMVTEVDKGRKAEPTRESPAVDRVTERWADFAKAMAIYPEANARVRSALEALLDAFGAAQATSAAPVRVTSADPAPDADGSAAPPNVSWLRSRLQQVCLAAVDFGPNVTEDALLDVTRKLLANFVAAKRSALPFETLWPETYPGVGLVPQVYDGWFSGQKSDVPPGHGAAARPNGFDPRVVERARRAMADIWEGREQVELDELCVEFLDRVQGVLPAGTKESERETDRICLRVLDSLAIGPMPSDATLTAMVASLARNPHGTQGVGNHNGARLAPPGAEKDAPDRMQGRPGDEKVGEDLQAFKTEYAALPTRRAHDLTETEVDVRAEQLDVLLHYLVTHAEDQDPDGLDQAIEDYVDGAGEEERHVLLETLAHYWRPEGDDEGPRSPNAPDPDQARQRLFAYLERTQRLALLRHAGILSVERVAAAFPQDFLVYLDCLDPDEAEDRAELVAVCERVGRSAIRAGASQLAAGGGLLLPSRMAVCLAEPDGAIAPLVRLVFEQGGAQMRPLVLEFLARLHGPGSLSEALHELGEPGRLPHDLCLALLETQPGGDVRDARLWSAAVEVCADIALSPPGGHAWAPSRMRAIETLGSLGTPRGEEALRRLLRRRWLVVAEESRQVREAARQALAGARLLAGGADRRV